MSQLSSQMTVVLCVVVAEDADNTEGQDDDEQENENENNTDYYDDILIRALDCICVCVSML